MPKCEGIILKRKHNYMNLYTLDWYSGKNVTYLRDCTSNSQESRVDLRSSNNNISERNSL